MDNYKLSIKIKGNKGKTQYISRFILPYLLFTAIIVLSNINPIQASEKSFVEFIIKSDLEIRKSEQLVFVIANNKALFNATIYSFEKINGAWKRVNQPFEATIGKNGLAAIGKKIEGDKKTPSGIFPLDIAFGYESYNSTKMKYRKITENDFWIDDVTSEAYNTWVIGKPKRGSYEIMRRKDGAYKYGFVVNYNTNPVIKGKGSAIFFHIWKGRTKPTAGCIALSEENILNLIKWLDPAKKPKVIIGTEVELASARLNE